jgi:hypothetical protein
MKNKRLFIGILLAAITSASLLVPLLLWEYRSIDPNFTTFQSTPTSVGRSVSDQGTPSEIATAEPIILSSSNCTYPLHFWKNRSDSWPEQVIAGQVTYTRAEMMAILSNPDPDIATRLITQMFATYLNALYAADITSIESTLMEANNWLISNPLDNPLSEFNQRRGVELARILEGFNNGEFGPGLCPGVELQLAEGDDPEDTPIPTEIALLITSPTQPGQASSPRAIVVVPPSTPTPAPPLGEEPMPVHPTSTATNVPANTLPAQEPTQPSAQTAAPSQTPQPTQLSSPTTAPTQTPQPTSIPVPTQTPAHTAPPTPTQVPSVTPTVLPTATRTATQIPPTNTPVPSLTSAVVSPEACNGVLGAITVDGLRVPSGATCTLNGTRVEGNAVVEGSGTLTTQSARIDGNLNAQSHARVSLLSGTTINGNIQITGGGPVRIVSIYSGGNLRLASNSQGHEISGSQINGNVDIVSNTGGVLISNNSINGNLACSGNVPLPSGSNNNVDGNTTGQCAALN